MRNYLLGTLATDRRNELEERILSDSDVYEELLLSEEELIDQYVAGSLSTEEEQQFETHFLITAERQNNLRFGRLLKIYLNSNPAFVHPNASLSSEQSLQSAPAKNSSRFSLASFGRGPVLATSAAVLLCAGLVFCFWAVARKRGPTTAQQNDSRLMVITLVPGSTGSSATTNRLTLPPSGVQVKLELEVAHTRFQNYKSELFRESQSLETQNELKMEARGEHHIVPVTIAGNMLSPGDYQLKLSGILDSGQDEFIDQYSFRVITE
jgi:anti-sigma-K factor RskA